jgi:hypothetical protein
MELLDFEGEKVGGIFGAECDRNFHRIQNKKTLSIVSRRKNHSRKF